MGTATASAAPVEGELQTDKPIAVYDPFRAQLADLEKQNALTVFQYETPKGSKAARSYIYKLRQTKSAIEAARKAEKEQSLAYGKRVDCQASEIKDRIDTMIKVHTDRLDEIERRERERVAAHESRLAAIIDGGNTAAATWMDMNLQEMRDWLAEIEGMVITAEQWEDFVARATYARETAIGQLQEAIAKREKHDAEQVELAELRRQQAEQRRKEEERAEAARQERLRQEGEERARLQAEEQRRQEQEAAARREQALRDEAERERQERIAAEQRAEAAAKEERERVEREQERQREEAAARESDRQHKEEVHRQAVAALKGGGLSEANAKIVVTLIAQRKVPRVSITY